MVPGGAAVRRRVWVLSRQVRLQVQLMPLQMPKMLQGICGVCGALRPVRLACVFLKCEGLGSAVVVGPHTTGTW